MKKRYLGLVLASLFSISLSACENGQSGPTIPPCDPMWDDCDNWPTQIFDLEKEKTNNYTFDQASNDNGSVSYEIFVRSFYDSDQNGIGDLNGIRLKLPYLKDLGVSNLWLMPIHPSPSYHGYDVIDYYGINPDYGTLNDFKNLVRDAKNSGIDIMLDMVFNHSSNRHPWFEQSYHDYKANNTSSNSKRNYYNWNTEHLGHKYKDLYYEGDFSDQMPDLNTSDPNVRKELSDILKYWTNLGVKGFRLDAVKHFTNNDDYNVEFLNYLKSCVPSDIQFVGECWASPYIIDKYYTSTIDSFFAFDAAGDSSSLDSIAKVVSGLRKANDFGNYIQDREATHKQSNTNSYSSYFLSNHDQDRISNSLPGVLNQKAASLYLLLPGTPYIYYGEEIALPGVRKENDNNDVRRRLPMIWSKSNNEGLCDFPDKSAPNLNSNNPSPDMGVEEQINQGYSLLNHYKKVINVRNKYPFIKDSVFVNETELLNVKNTKVLAYLLKGDNQEITIIHNFNEFNIEVDLPGDNLKIKDSISYNKLIPEIKGNKLRIGDGSTVVLSK